VQAASVDSRFKESIVSNPILETKWSTVIFLMINLPARGSGLPTHEHTCLVVVLTAVGRRFHRSPCLRAYAPGLYVGGLQ
jgi:hypothetical protein